MIVWLRFYTNRYYRGITGPKTGWTSINAASILPISGGAITPPLTLLHYEVKVAVLWSIGEIEKVPTFITNIELYGQESRKTSFGGFYYYIS
jgi:hypothetical protein